LPSCLTAITLERLLLVDGAIVLSEIVSVLKSLGFTQELSSSFTLEDSSEIK